MKKIMKIKFFILLYILFAFISGEKLYMYCDPENNCPEKLSIDIRRGDIYADQSFNRMDIGYGNPRIVPIKANDLFKLSDECSSLNDLENITFNHLEYFKFGRYCGVQIISCDGATIKINGRREAAAVKLKYNDKHIIIDKISRVGSPLPPPNPPDEFLCSGVRNKGTKIFQLKNELNDEVSNLYLVAIDKDENRFPIIQEIKRGDKWIEIPKNDYCDIRLYFTEVRTGVEYYVKPSGDKFEIKNFGGTTISTGNFYSRISYIINGNKKTVNVDDGKIKIRGDITKIRNIVADDGIRNAVCNIDSDQSLNCNSGSILIIDLNSTVNSNKKNKSDFKKFLSSILDKSYNKRIAIYGYRNFYPMEEEDFELYNTDVVHSFYKNYDTITRDNVDRFLHEDVLNEVSVGDVKRIFYSFSSITDQDTKTVEYTRDTAEKMNIESYINSIKDNIHAHFFNNTRYSIDHIYYISYYGALGNYDYDEENTKVVFYSYHNDKDDIIRLIERL